MITKGVKWAVMTLSFAIAACADNHEAALEPIAVASVFVTPSARDLMVGDTARLSAVLLAGRLTHWRSDQPLVASVDTTGLVTAVGGGTTLVHAAPCRSAVA